MKTLKIVAYFLVGIIAFLLLIAAFVNRDYKISREITISKPKNVVFDYAKLLKNQNNYSVWALADPNMKKEFKGTDGIVGFVSAWDSPVKDVGKGEQEIIGIIDGERIDYELRFLEPMESKDHAYMTFDSITDTTTLVKWGFNGSMPYPMNLSLLFMDLDGMLGKDLDQGLANLKTILEKQ